MGEDRDDHTWKTPAELRFQVNSLSRRACGDFLSAVVQRGLFGNGVIAEAKRRS